MNTSTICLWYDRWGSSWQITAHVVADALAQQGDVAARAFAAVMGMRKIGVARIGAAVEGARQ